MLARTIRRAFLKAIADDRYILLDNFKPGFWRRASAQRILEHPLSAATKQATGY